MLITLKYLSDVLALPADVVAVLPDQIWRGEDRESIPVLYLLHGFAGDSADFLRFTSIERYAWLKGVAVIMPSGYNSAYTDMKYGEDYFTYLSQELPFFIHNTLRLSCARANTFVCGCSMGGYGATKWAMSEPEKFAGLISLSGSLHVEDRLAGLSRNIGHQLNGMYGDPPCIDPETQDVFVMLRRNIEIGKRMPRMLLTCAEDDKPYLRKATDDFYQEVIRYGIQAEKIGGFGGHGYQYWDPQLLRILDFCLETMKQES